MIKLVNKVYQFLLSKKRQLQVEKFIYLIAILTFIIHFSLVLLIHANILPIGYYRQTDKLPNVLTTIYTPFTIILLYEIYLLIYYLPHSITIYLGKQYEIVSLILIRSIFDQLARLPVGTPEFTLQDLRGMAITFAILAAILLLTFCFYKLSDDKKSMVGKEQYSSLQYYKYVVTKRGLSILLLIFFVILSIGSIYVITDFEHVNFEDFLTIIKRMNGLFFSYFFDALIITEVLLLLYMYKISNDFEKVIRNSGFIISTILLKLSFRTEGFLFLVMALGAVFIGVVTSGIYKLYLYTPAKKNNYSSNQETTL